MVLPGFNTDFKYHGQTFHAQTEDNGANNPAVVTLLYFKGAILASRKTTYRELLAKPDYQKELMELMRAQHKDLMRELLAGTYDESIPGSAAAKPATAQAAPKPAAAAAPPVSAPTAAAPAAAPTAALPVAVPAVEAPPVVARPAAAPALAASPAAAAPAAAPPPAAPPATVVAAVVPKTPAAASPSPAPQVLTLDQAIRNYLEECAAAAR